MHVNFKVIILLSLLLTGCQPAPERITMTKKDFINGALTATFCEKPPCKKRTAQEIFGPARTENEWRTLAANGDKAAQRQQCEKTSSRNIT